MEQPYRKSLHQTPLKRILRRRDSAVREGKPRICPLTDEVTRCNGLCKIVDPPNKVKICSLYKLIFFEDPICKISVSRCPYVGSLIKREISQDLASGVRCPRCGTIQAVDPDLSKLPSVPMSCSVCHQEFAPKEFAR